MIKRRLTNSYNEMDLLRVYTYDSCNAVFVDVVQWPAFVERDDCQIHSASIRSIKSVICARILTAITIAH